jgi:hypothetical protein
LDWARAQRLASLGLAVGLYLGVAALNFVAVLLLSTGVSLGGQVHSSLTLPEYGVVAGALAVDVVVIMLMVARVETSRTGPR